MKPQQPKAHKRRAKRTEARACGIESRGAPLPLRGERALKKSLAIA